MGELGWTVRRIYTRTNTHTHTHTHTHTLYICVCVCVCVCVCLWTHSNRGHWWEYTPTTVDTWQPRTVLGCKGAKKLNLHLFRYSHMVWWSLRRFREVSTVVRYWNTHRVCVCRRGRFRRKTGHTHNVHGCSQKFQPKAINDNDNFRPWWTDPTSRYNWEILNFVQKIVSFHISNFVIKIFDIWRTV